MDTTSFNFPTDTRVGSGVISQLNETRLSLGIHRPLVVTDSGLLETDAFKRLAAALLPGEPERDWFLHSDVQPNPTEANTRGAAELALANGCDGVIGLGGGSALDAAKVCRILIKQPQLKLADYDWEADWSGLLPFIAIPTTAGTGSEVGRSGVVTPDGGESKGMYFHPELLAKCVFLDPELTTGLPPGLTAATGLDALTHCIESYTSPVFQPLCDGIALEGIALIVRALPAAITDGSDLDARGQMLVAAAMGGVAFQKDLGATHSLAHPLSAICGVHHGTANAICLPPVMRFNAQKKPGVYRRIGLACGLDVVSCSDADADEQTIHFIDDFIRRCGMPLSLEEVGVEEQYIEALADQAWLDPCHQTNPVTVTREDLKELFLKAL
ncbi:MAG: iron-containing alcohol dehydrogenase [Verrucomicrobiota bacterium]|nr:iron-containing alcohol dehydrogenase [Verrucomicrobiota bacterium]